mgnify:CR=1 FL=1
MASAFKVGGKELVEDAACHVVVDEAARHHQHIGIVVLTDEVGNLGLPAESGTDALMLVEGHADALAAAAHGDAGEHLARLDAACQCMAVGGIVARLLGVGAVVLVGIAMLFKILFYELFEWKGSVVAGNSNCLYFHFLCF